MYSYQVVEFGKPLERRDYPTPKPAGSEVVVRIAGCGVCHSDLHLADGFFDLGGGKRITLADRGTKLPFTPGHEMVGEVEALGPEASGVKPGDRRIVFPWIGCGTCEPCAVGEETFCANPRFLGARRDGGYSTHIVVPHAKYLIAYGDVPEDLASTYACSGITAYSALKKIPKTTGRDHIVMIGAGGVGTAGILLSSAVHEAKVIVADVDAKKRESALKSNRVVAAVDPSKPEAVKQVLDLTGGVGVAAAIDYVGAPATAQFGLDVIRRGGTLVSVGLFGGAASVSLPLMPMRSVNWRGSYVGTLAEMHEMMGHILGGKVPRMPIEPRPLAAANGALDDLRAGRVIGRVVLKPALDAK